MIAAGARVWIADPGEPEHGRYGTVTVAEHPALLTGRPMVEVRVDGNDEAFDTGFYVEQVEELLQFLSTKEEIDVVR